MIGGDGNQLPPGKEQGSSSMLTITFEPWSWYDEENDEVSWEFEGQQEIVNESEDKEELVPEPIEQERKEMEELATTIAEFNHITTNSKDDSLDSSASRKLLASNDGKSSTAELGRKELAKDKLINVISKYCDLGDLSRTAAKGTISEMGNLTYNTSLYLEAVKRAKSQFGESIKNYGAARKELNDIGEEEADALSEMGNLTYNTSY